MAEKEAIVFIIDVGKSMSKKRNGRNLSDLDWSLQWVWDRITNVVSLGRKTIVVGVIALGSDLTSNNMSEDDSYRNINIVQQMSPMAMPELRSLPPLLKPSNTDQRDAMSAIILAVDLIMRHCRHLQFKKHIYLVTNATGAMDPDDVEATVEQINQNNIELTVLGVDFDDPEYGFKEEEKSYTKLKNENVLKELVEKSHGTFGTMQEAIEGLSIPHVKPIRPTPTYKGQLRLGDPANYDTAITIDIERYFRIAVRRPPTASSFVIRSDQIRNDIGLAPVQSARTYSVYDPTQPNNEQNVLREDLAKGYQYGRTAVPISESDENITKLETDAGYEILGFIPKENIERYMVIDNTNMLVAQKGNDKAAFALSSLIHALFEIDSCAIARFVKKDMVEPVITLLTPYADDEIESLIENILPFAEDLRQYRFPPIDKILTVSGKQFKSHRHLPDKALTRAMDEFVDDMTLTHSDQLDVGNIFSPVLHSIEGAIRHRAVHDDDSLPVVPAAFLVPSRQPQELVHRSQASLRDLVEAADVKKVPPKVKGRRKYREVETPLSGLDVDTLFRKSHGTKISANNPIPEFKQAIERTEDEQAISDAAQQLMTIIEDQIRDSFGDNNYDRAIEELTVLRDELRELEVFEVWHALIKSLKQKILSEQLGGNRKEMWWKIRTNRLGLIDATQEQNAKVTPEEAAQFLLAK